MTKRKEIMVGFTTGQKETLLCVFLCLLDQDRHQYILCWVAKADIKKKNFHYPRLENPEDRIWDNDGNWKIGEQRA